MIVSWLYRDMLHLCELFCTCASFCFCYKSMNIPGLRLVALHNDCVLALLAHVTPHTPSIAFRHLPPDSARFSYATEGALFISAQLSTDAVSALRKVLIIMSVKAAKRQSTHEKGETHPHRLKKRRKKRRRKKEFRLDSNDCGFICAGVNFVGSYSDRPCFI